MVPVPWRHVKLCVSLSFLALRYAFPAVFLATGFARRSSVTGDSFMAVASLLLLPTCLTGCSEPSTWRSSHLFLLIVTALVAVASLTVQILCRAGSLSAAWTTSAL